MRKFNFKDEYIIPPWASKVIVEVDGEDVFVEFSDERIDEGKVYDDEDA